MPHTDAADPSLRTGTRTAAGATQIYLAESLILPTGLVTAAYLTRTLGPSDYGVFTLCATIVSWLGWLVAAVLSRATIKLVSEQRPADLAASALVAALFRIHLVAAAGVCALLVGFAEPLAHRFGEPSMAGYLRLFALEILTFGLAVFHRDLLIGEGRFGERATASAVRWVLRMVLILALVHAGLSLYGAVLGSVLASAAELFVARYYVRPSPFPRGVLLERLLPVLAPLAGYAICMRLMGKLDLFMLKALGGSAAEAGFYGAAQNLSIAVGMLTLAVSPALLTHLGSQRAVGHTDEARRTAALALRFPFLLLAPVAAAIAARHEIVVLLFGDRFAATAPLLGILLCAEVAMVTTSVATVLLIAADRHRPVFVVALLMLVAAFALHIRVIPTYGALGAASVTAGVACAGATCAFSIAAATWSVRVPLATLLRALVLTTIAYALASIDCEPVALVVPKLAAVVGVVLVGFLALGELSADERSRLRGVIAAASSRSRAR